MDFALPLIERESTASKSNIRYLPPVTSDTASGSTPDERKKNVVLDNFVIHTSNQAAYELFWGSTTHATQLPFQQSLTSNDKSEGIHADAPDPQQQLDNDHATSPPRFDPDMGWMLDASIYKDRMTPTHPTIQPGDLVVIQESFDSLDFVYVQPGAIYQNRNGSFHHNDFLEQPFGTKIRSRDLRGYGFIYLLKPTPELWTRSLNHRTQVVHELDQSQIIFQLYIKPNDIVVESGTGSGAMSHALIRTVAPAGHVHTYEFNQHRAESARHEFLQHGLQHLVTVHHKDVCRGLVEANVDNDAPPPHNGAIIVEEGTSGFDLPGQTVNAVVLDLPEPWLAVPHAAYVLKPNGRIASYSPCVEQTQKTIVALEAAGFHSIKTMEYRLQEHYVDEVEYEPPPAQKLARPEPHNIALYQNSGLDEVQESDHDDETAEHAAGTMPTMASDSEGQPIVAETAGAGASQSLESNCYKRKRKLLVARPFVMMRGHTAFLTFATAGLEIRMDPNRHGS
jgi:tRNA (adenine57-N1/adenine58-N1)-methyltransferase catalytic subunit